MFAEHTSESDGCHFGLWVGWGELHTGSNTSVYLRQPSSPFAKVRTALAIRRMRRAESRKAQVTYSFVDLCPVEPWWGGRDMLLFDGPIDGVRFIGSISLIDEDLRRRSPQWWWPSDRTWFMSTEIDHPWTYVAGSAQLIDRILHDSELQAVQVGFDDRW